MAQRFLKFAYFAGGLTVKIEHVDLIPNDSPFILISNHQSQLDIASIVITSPKDVSFFAKKELERVPVLGGIMKAFDNLSIDRKNPRVAAQQLKSVHQKIINGRSVVVFPEGTRSRNGHMQSFKKGAFVLSDETGVPLVPVYIKGTGSILPSGTFFVRPGVITLTCFPQLNSDHSIENANKRVVDLKNRAFECLSNFEKSIQNS